MKVTGFFALVLTVLILAGFGSSSQDRNASFINSVSGTADSVPPDYVPPLISNGTLNMLVDFQGCQFQKEYVGMTPCIFQAGRRYGPPKDALVPFGYFVQEISVNGKILDRPDSWTQTLDTKEAKVTCVNNYREGITVESELYTHLLKNLVVVKKRFYTGSGEKQKVSYSFKYRFVQKGRENKPPWRITSRCGRDDSGYGVRFDYDLDGHPASRGMVSLFSDEKTRISLKGQDASLTSVFRLERGDTLEISYFLSFEDSMDGDQFRERGIEMQKEVLVMGTKALSASHQAAWAEYYDESYVHLPDHRMESVYNTAQYHLRSNATKWSFPVGIFTTHWSGRYFGWDEMFCFQALASSNHLNISKRCPDYRFATLPVALKRVAHYSKPGLFGARYPWISIEDGSNSTGPGFWEDHVFHMSNIVLSSWFQYLYSGDEAYLRSTGYPVIRECARFYFTHMVYETADGSMFVGKSTDLERLGPAVLNPFMTACGVIYTFESAARASEILNTDAEEAKAWKNAAEKLAAGLPQENGMYVPYAGCRERSVASLGGLFPYPVFDSDNQLQRNAVYDFVNEGKASGNMYPVGKSMCAWYAGWLASALDLLGDRNEPAKLLKEAANGAGCFSDLFEINEPEVRMHPWFSTASGNYVYAMNQMLVQSKDELIRIAPAVPENWTGFSFKLACYGNLVAEVSVSNGKISKLILIPGDHSKRVKRTIVIPSQYLNERILSRIQTPYRQVNGSCELEFDFSGPKVVL